jgi:hypothetical protein
MMSPFVAAPRKKVWALLAAALACLPFGAAQAEPTAVIPALDHVLVVVMENHGYIATHTASYTAKLIRSGAVFTSSYATTHPSQPNYLALWAGSTLGVSDDACPAPGSPFTAENLGHACEAAGKTWRAYSENLPSAGSDVCSADGALYTRKHDPWTNFANLDHMNERPYSDLADDIANHRLPSLAFVIPNNCDNTHDCSVATGDAWLAANLPAMITAAGTNGLVILTWDEDDGSTSNQVLTVFASPWVRAGTQSTASVDHYDVLRTICDALRIAAPGSAATATPIADVWLSLPTPIGAGTWGALKTLYR